MTPVQKTLAELVAIDSVSSHSNAAIVDYLSQRCQAMEFSIQRFSYIDELGIEKINLIALAGTEFGKETEVALALVGHTDTVPFDAAWAEATTLEAREGKLFGRGACDTKGFIAAALSATEQYSLDRLRRPLALIFTCDEEIGLLGAKYLARLKPLRVSYCIVGEPTSLRPIRAGKGYSLAEVIVRGREAHSAYPALGASAIFRAARLLTRIESIAQVLVSEQHPDFDPPFTTLNVGVVKGGSAKNVIAGDCRFTLEWRPIPGQDPVRVLHLLEAAVADEKQLDPDFDCEINASRSDFGFETASRSSLVSFLENATGYQAETVSFGTEASQMMLLGSDAVVLGPGDIRVAHRTGEFVPADELERCTDILSQAIKEFCC
jgi:acetylornithine deacetylase